MKKKIVFLSLMFLFSCSNESAKELMFIRTISPKLYVETYREFGSGALGGDLVTDYITDSTNFRQKYESYDNAEFRFKYSLVGDTILIQKLKVSKEPRLELVETEKILLNKLRQKKMFD